MNNQQLQVELDNVLYEFRDGLQELSKKEDHLKVVTNEHVQATLTWENGEWLWEEQQEEEVELKKRFPSSESALLTMSPSFQRWFHGQLASRLSSLAQ
ncbi:Schizosaccharomyces specific protein [Schizosaccharomyces osmophilus]|uniref:Schizosaccharomyces specific protein n=1 Tax=Schizosaccharomyces osmophilus TaxID=2545709 RepID=A0AAE9WDK3_9SCHI|nr:Schizosaccharomyces specific protein [Schizosaccharomyces osmophilus]WBW72743.1 Schizosaccharomyces specific protein [Schizosaccharomyces osmophilus]